jgi:drug/metabolite transporter (DMT)-like permease
MSETPTVELSVRQAINRGFNLLAAGVLGLAGLAFGSLIFEEADPIDKVDNSILVLVAILAVAWYLIGNHRYERSAVPIALAGTALAGQLLGIAIEAGDPAAIGDDIGGMLLFVPLLILLLVVNSSDKVFLSRA